MVTVQIVFSGTVVQLIAVLTRPKAFIKPKPNLVLNQKPAAFCCQPGLSTTGSTSEVQTIKCWTSLQLRFGLQEFRSEKNQYLLVLTSPPTPAR